MQPLPGYELPRDGNHVPAAGGFYSSSTPTIIANNVYPLQLDSSGNLLVNVVAGGSGGGNVNLNQVGGASYSLGQTTASGSLPVTVATNDSVLTNTTGVVQAASTTANSSNNIQTYGAEGAVVVLNISAVSGGNVTLVINGVTSSGYTYPILQPTSVSLTGVTAYRVGRGLTPASGMVANDVVPKTLQIVATVSGSITYGIDYELGV